MEDLAVVIGDGFEDAWPRIGLGVLKAGFRAMRKGYVGGQPVGNVKMMPGTFIVDTQGRIAYTFYSNHVGDHPTIDDVITAARQINADKER